MVYDAIMVYSEDIRALEKWALHLEIRSSEFGFPWRFVRNSVPLVCIFRGGTSALSAWGPSGRILSGRPAVAASTGLAGFSDPIGVLFEEDRNDARPSWEASSCHLFFGIYLEFLGFM